MKFILYKYHLLINNKKFSKILVNFFFFYLLYLIKCYEILHNDIVKMYNFALQYCLNVLK